MTAQLVARIELIPHLISHRLLPDHPWLKRLGDSLNDHWFPYALQRLLGSRRYYMLVLCKSKQHFMLLAVLYNVFVA